MDQEVTEYQQIYPNKQISSIRYVYTAQISSFWITELWERT